MTKVSSVGLVSSDKPSNQHLKTIDKKPWYFVQVGGVGEVALRYVQSIEAEMTRNPLKLITFKGETRKNLEFSSEKFVSEQINQLFRDRSEGTDGRRTCIAFPKYLHFSPVDCSPYF